MFAPYCSTGQREQANNQCRSVIKSIQAISEENGDKDRISSLPRNVIDRILELMPVRDAARTCVLSSGWRFIWADHPTVLLDNKFWDNIKHKRSPEDIDFAADIVNRIFVHHMGRINKFVLDISVVCPERHCDINLWLLFVSTRGVKVLSLENSKSTPYMTPYTVPSCVLANSELTSLGITNCILKIPKSFRGFSKLESLSLYHLALGSWVLTTPLLTSLTLKYCRGIYDFTISAPRLVSLNLYDNNDLNLMPYLTCTDIMCAYISLSRKHIHRRDCGSVNLMKLLSCWPKLSKLLLDGESLKYLATGTVPEEFPLVLNLRRFVPFRISSNMDQMAWILCIIKNSPLLCDFEIWFSGVANSDMELANYLEEPSTMNQRMEKLRAVKMRYFNASRAELLFTKILLRCAPSLERMLVEENEQLDAIERLRISKELMRLPRASPSAKIILEPNLFPA